MNKLAIIIVALLAIAGLSSFFVIDETEFAIVTRFGQYRKSVTEPGLNFKMPFVEEVRRMDSRILGSDTPATEFLTLDKKRLVVDPITRWRIKDPLIFYKTVNEEISAQRRLDDIVQGELRREIASVNFGDIIGNARDPLMQQVRDRVTQKAQEFGITVVDVRIKRADLPAQVQESVFARMRAERDREAKRYRSEGEEEAAKIRADTDKEVTILLAQAYETAQKLRGEGDAESTRIYAAAYNKDPEFYSFTRALEAYDSSVTSDTKAVLSTGADLLKYFETPKKQR